MIVDAHVHVLDRELGPLRRIDLDEMLRAMDDVGVDAALLTNVTILGPDDALALEGARRHPGRFAVIGGIDYDLPDLGPTLETRRTNPRLLGVRVGVMFDRQIRAWDAGRYQTVFAAAERHRLPVCVFAPGRVGEIKDLAGTHPDLQIVLDHLCLDQTPARLRTDDPFAQMPTLLDLARFPNVAVKLSALPALSREPFPFEDLRPHIDRVLDAFGVERVMWGSDWTRRNLPHTYDEQVRYLDAIVKLTRSERNIVMGATLRRIFHWDVPSA